MEGDETTRDGIDAQILQHTKFTCGGCVCSNFFVTSRAPSALNWHACRKRSLRSEPLSSVITPPIFWSEIDFSFRTWLETFKTLILRTSCCYRSFQWISENDPLISLKSPPLHQWATPPILRGKWKHFRCLGKYFQCFANRKLERFWTSANRSHERRVRSKTPTCAFLIHHFL